MGFNVNINVDVNVNGKLESAVNGFSTEQVGGGVNLSLKGKSKMLSDELYLAIEKMKYDKAGCPLGEVSVPWIHLQDAVDCGSVSPMEAYDAIDLGYVPEHLKVRESRYQHLI